MFRLPSFRPRQVGRLFSHIHGAKVSRSHRVHINAAFDKYHQYIGQKYNCPIVSALLSHGISSGPISFIDFAIQSGSAPAHIVNLNFDIDNGTLFWDRQEDAMPNSMAMLLADYVVYQQIYRKIQDNITKEQAMTP